MKRIALFIYVLMVSSCLMGQEAQLEWAVSLGGSGSEEGNSVVVDNQGNVYTTGYFTGTADFDPDPVSEYNLVSNGKWDIFVSKLDPQGNFVWAVSFGGADYDNAHDLAIGANGDVYLTGFFNGNVDFDPGKDILNLASSGDYDVFVTKLNSEGQLIWAKSMGSTKTDYGYTLAVDNHDNIYVSGHFKSKIDIDPGSESYWLEAEASSDIFICKLDKDGEFLWANSMGGNGTDKAFSLALDREGNVYTTGQFKEKIIFNSDNHSEILTSTGDNDVYITKLDTEGNFVWAKGIGGKGDDQGYSVEIDATGNIYVNGKFSGVSDFDPGENKYELTSNGATDLFLLKLNPQGDFLFAKSIGGTELDYACSLAFDQDMNIYQTGVFAGTVDFDPGPGVENLTSNGSWDIFISKLDSQGNFLWAKKIGGTHYDNGYGLYINDQGNLYATGYFMETSDFSMNNNSQELHAQGDWDVFVLKMTQPGPIKSCFSTSSFSESLHFEKQLTDL